MNPSTLCIFKPNHVRLSTHRTDSHAMIFKKFPVLFFSLCLSFLNGFSVPANQEITDSTGLSENKGISICRDSVFSFRSQRGFVPSLIRNFGEQAAAPFNMSSRQALMVAGGVVITGALFFADENMDKFFKPLKEKNRWIDNSSPKITELGGNYAFVVTGAFFGYSIVNNDRKAFQTTLLCMQAAITSGTWVRLGKILTCRERPVATYIDNRPDHDFWWGPFQQFNSRISNHRGMAYFDAFPSGHAATAFSIASVFAHQYADKPFVSPVAYSIATLVGITRLTEHDHWVSDVFAGACIGYLCGKQVVKHARRLDEASSHAYNKKIKPEYFFSLSGESLMVNCTMVF